MPADQPPTTPPPAGPAHATRPPHRPSRIAAGVGAAAVLAAVGLGSAALLRAPADVSSGATSLQAITVASAPATPVPLTDAQILALLGRPPELGPLADARRLASCLAGLGYPGSTTVLGAQPIDVNGHRAVLLVLPGARPDTVAALAVAPACSSADTGLIADTAVPRP